MGLLFGRKNKDAAHDPGTVTPDQQAHDLVWDREMARLGRVEVVRRLAALSDYRGGRTGPSGFEQWNQEIERRISALASEIAGRQHF